jgi:hypothetical protein
VTPAPLSLRVALTLVRTWTRVYTIGLPATLRECRIAEIESDLWEYCHDSMHPAGHALAIIGRLVRGMPDDIGWRAACVTGSSNAARWTLAAILALAVLTSSIWVASATRNVPLPQPPAAPDLVTKRASYPPPPPPPPPPCNPPGIGRAPFTPCMRY